MSANEIKENLINVINKVMELDLPFDLVDATNIFIDLSFNSFKMIELLIEIESVFKIHIEADDYDYEKISTIEELVKMISGKIND